VNCCIEQPRERRRCPQCGGAEVWMRGHQERTFRTVPIGSKPTAVTLDVARVWCPVCETVRQVKVGFADPKKRYLRSFERYTLERSRHRTSKDVAEHLQVRWDTVQDLQASNLQRRFGKPKLHQLKQSASDAIAVAKGQRYRTVVLKLLSGAVVFVGDGKSVAARKPF
jgi:transposase